MVLVILFVLLTVLAGAVIVGVVVADARRRGEEMLPEASLERLEALKERSEELRVRSQGFAAAARTRTQSVSTGLRHAAHERRGDADQAKVA